MVGELAAGHMADMEFKTSTRLWNTGHRVAAPGAVAQKDLDVLAGPVGEVVVRWKLELHQHNIVGQARQGADPGREFLDGYGSGFCDLA